MNAALDLSFRAEREIYSTDFRIRNMKFKHGLGSITLNVN
jgi:hypothetical protein